MSRVTLARAWHQNLWMMSAQPVLQIVLPYFLLGRLTIFVPMNALFYLKEMKKFPVHWLLPFLWISSGTLAGLVCALAKWVLVGKKKEGETVMIWRKGIYMDTIWQAIRTMVGDYFMEMTTGSFLFGFWINLMGSEIDWDEEAYVDSMGSVLNPEMVRVEGYGSVEREALLLGHIYEGDGGKVKFRKTEIREAGSVGCRAVVMPGVMVDCEGSLDALSFAIKGHHQVKAVDTDIISPINYSITTNVPHLSKSLTCLIKAFLVYKTNSNNNTGGNANYLSISAL